MKFSVWFGILLGLSALAVIGEGKPLDFDNPLGKRSSVEGFFQKGYDVITGKRNLKVETNILTGEIEVTTSYTKEEILGFVAIGCAILMILIACLLCCIGCIKACCCPKKAPVVIEYKYMETPQPQPSQGIPMYNQVGGPAPPPYRK